MAHFVRKFGRFAPVWLTSFAGLVLFLPISLGGCQPPPPSSYDARGVIVSITPSRSFIEVDHEAIPGFMEAMTMRFPVADTALLSGMSVGDSISFLLEEGPIGYQMTQITAQP